MLEQFSSKWQGAGATCHLYSLHSKKDKKGIFWSNPNVNDDQLVAWDNIDGSMNCIGTEAPVRKRRLECEVPKPYKFDRKNEIPTLSFLDCFVVFLLLKETQRFVRKH